MGIFRQFPYTNFHDLNMDWFLSEFKNLILEWQVTSADWKNWKNDTDKAIAELNEIIETRLSDTAISEYLSALIRELIESGEFESIIAEVLAELVTDEFIAGDYNITRFSNAENENTFVYWRKIPAEYQPYVAQSETNTKDPVKMAAETGASIAINASRWYTDTGDFYGYFRSNGITLNDNEFEDPDISTNSSNILFFKNNRIGSINIRTATDVLNENDYEWALTGFEAIIIDGVPQPRANPENPDATTDFQPRSFIAQNYNGDYIIGCTDGRSGRSKGFRLSDMTRFLQSLNENITFAYSLDGGGSVFLYEKGYRVNAYINNEYRNLKSVICFKKPESAYSNTLKQAVANAENMYRALNNNYEYMQGNIYAYGNDTTKGIEFRSLSDLVSQAFIRMQRERFFVGVDHDFSNTETAHLLLDVSNSAFQWNGVNRAILRLINNTADYVDTIPNIGQTAVNCIQFTSGAAAQNAGLSNQDYGFCIMITFRTNGTYTIILTRANIWFRWDTGAFKRVMFES